MRPPTCPHICLCPSLHLENPSLITETGTAILGSGLLATAISQELYVFNDETVVAVGYFILFACIAKVRPVSFPPFRFPFYSTSVTSVIRTRTSTSAPESRTDSSQKSPTACWAMHVEHCRRLFFIGAALVCYAPRAAVRAVRPPRRSAQTCRPFACRTKSGPRTTLLASRACSMVRVQNTRRP
jgi:hypothetical protein